PGGERQPRGPGRPATSQSNARDGGDDDNDVHDQRPRPRLPLTNPRPTREVFQCGEREPERAKCNQHGSCHGGAHREPSTTPLHYWSCRCRGCHAITRPRACCGGERRGAGSLPAGSRGAGSVVRYAERIVVVISRAPSPACAAAGPSTARVSPTAVLFSARRHAAQNKPRLRSPSPRAATHRPIRSTSTSRPSETGSLSANIGRGSRKFRRRDASTGEGSTRPVPCNSYGLKRPSGWRTCDGGART